MDPDDFILHKLAHKIGNPMMDSVGFGQVMAGPAHAMVTITEQTRTVIGVVFSERRKDTLLLLVEMIECDSDECDQNHHWWIEGFANTPKKKKQRKRWDPEQSFFKCWMPLRLPGIIEFGLDMALEAARDDLIEKIDKRHA